jgi:hypothetical protein
MININEHGDGHGNMHNAQCTNHQPINPTTHRPNNRIDPGGMREAIK